MSDTPTGNDPQRRLRAWLPHLTLLGLAAAALIGLLWLLMPLLTAMLLAGGLVLLTQPVLHAPMLDHLRRWCPHWPDERRRHLAALIATIAIAVIAVGFLLLFAWALTGSVFVTIQAIVGIALQDQAAIQALVNVLMQKVQHLAGLYPALPIDVAAVRQWLEANLGNAAVSQALLGYLVSGTGSALAQIALALVTLFYLTSEGSWLTGHLFNCLPLTTEQREGLTARFRITVLHLWLRTGAQALAHGFALGLIAWAIGGFNPVLVGVVAGVIALLPLVGPTIAWLPLVSLLWPASHSQALLLGACSLIATLIIGWQCRRLAARLGTNHIWLDFLLFLGLVGGVLSAGPRGFILGPAAVLVVAILAQVLPMLYGRGESPSTGADTAVRR